MRNEMRNTITVVFSRGRSKVAHVTPDPVCAEGAENSTGATVELDFAADYLEMMRASLYWWGYVVPANLSFDEVARRFYNVWRRNVAVRPRRIHQAAELIVPSGHAAAYAQFWQKSKPV